MFVTNMYWREYIMNELQQNYINNLGNWKKTCKKQYSVYMCMPGPGISIHNFLEKANYVTDNRANVVLSGTIGEQWVTNIEKVAKTYKFADGTPITASTLNNRMKSGRLDWTEIKTLQLPYGSSFACFLPKQNFRDFPIQTSWAVLIANSSANKVLKGDFLVCDANADGSPNLSDIRVVNEKIFVRTYDLRGIRKEDRVKASEDELNTPKPTKSLGIKLNLKDATKTVMGQLYNMFDGLMRENDYFINKENGAAIKIKSTECDVLISIVNVHNKNRKAQIEIKDNGIVKYKNLVTKTHITIDGLNIAQIEMDLKTVLV